MSKTKVKKETCAKCGVDVRKNTQFCYNCGSQIASPQAKSTENGTGSEIDANAQSALDELEAKLKAEEPQKTEKLQKAADERRKARVQKRRPRTYRWEPIPTSSVSLVLIMAVVIAILAAVVVALTVFFK